MSIPAFADDSVDAVLQDLYNTYQTVQQFCGGISDRISSVSGVSKINTAVTAVGTSASGGALVTGIIKSQTDKKIITVKKDLDRKTIREIKNTVDTFYWCEY